MARILLVDDEHSIRLMVRLALQHVGHTVETAVDGPDSLAQFGDGSDFDLVLLDQRMPGMQGIEVLREMRARRPEAQVIMITAFGTVDLAAEAMRLGARDLLRKPFTVETLRGAVSSVLGTPERSERHASAYGPITVNGFRVTGREMLSPAAEKTVRLRFSVRTPAGESESCVVELPPPAVAMVERCAESAALGVGFWGGLCEEVLANYVWQNADLPAHGALRVEELTGGMKRWISATLKADAGALEACADA